MEWITFSPTSDLLPLTPRFQLPACCTEGFTPPHRNSGFLGQGPLHSNARIWPALDFLPSPFSPEDLASDCASEAGKRDFSSGTHSFFLGLVLISLFHPLRVFFFRSSAPPTPRFFFSFHSSLPPSAPSPSSGRTGWSFQAKRVH